MALPFSSLTVHRLRDEIDGEPVKALKDFIDPENKSKSYRLKGRFNFDAQLFVPPPERTWPTWVNPLESGFGKLNIPPSVSSGALLILKTRKGGKDLHFALTFGGGKSLLVPGALQDKYGFRVAINAIYRKRRRGEKVDLQRIRSVGSKKIAANVLRTQRQADRKTDFESFEIDTQSDLLSGLTGTPSNNQDWGKRIGGSDALHLVRKVPFEELGKICLQVEEHSKKLPRNFAWVDHIRAVRNSAIIARLKRRILKKIRTGDVINLELSPPEIIEWGNIDRFRFSFASKDKKGFEDPSIEIYLQYLERKNKRHSLTLGQLTSSHRLIAFNASNQKINDYEWTVFKSLSGEIKLGTKTYILSEGSFFQVAKNYLDDLNRTIDRLPKFKGHLLDSKKGWLEDRYNKEAARQNGFFLLDRKTVRLPSRTTAIEICDLLTPDRKLIHVKRKTNSSSLSHLFAQGLVSADLLLTNEEFRERAHQRIKGLEKRRHVSNKFSVLLPPDKGITPSHFTVVYGIITPRKERFLSELLPFFSKINLRRCAQDLRRRGFRVACKKIDELARIKKPKRLKPAKASTPPKFPPQRAVSPAVRQKPRLRLVR